MKWGVGKLIARATTRPIVVPIYHYNMEQLMPQDEKNRLISVFPMTNLDLGVIVGEPLSFDDLFERYTDGRVVGDSPWETQEREKALYSAITRRIEDALLALEKKTHHKSSNNRPASQSASSAVATTRVSTENFRKGPSPATPRNSRAARLANHRSRH